MDKKKMTAKQYFRHHIFIAALSLTISGCGNHGEENNTILLSGTVEARELDLGFQVGGRIDQLLVDEGYAVTSSQPVAQLETQDFELAVQQAEGQAAAAKATLAALQAGSRKQEIKTAQAGVTQADAQLAFAASEVDRVKTLAAQQLAPKEQLDQKRTQYEVAKTTLKQAQENLKLLQEGPRKEDIQRAEATYKANVAATDLARRRLTYTQLATPAAGVISVRLAEKGQVVATGQPVLRVAELGRPWIRAYLNETDLSRVRLGQTAAVTVDGVKQAFQGHLSFISPVAEFTPKTVETRQLRVDLVYRIKVDVENPQGVLKIGMPADVKLVAVQ